MASALISVLPFWTEEHFFFFCATPSSARSLLLALSSEFTPNDVQWDHLGCQGQTRINYMQGKHPKQFLQLLRIIYLSFFFGRGILSGAQWLLLALLSGITTGRLRSHVECQTRQALCLTLYYHPLPLRVIFNMEFKLGL